MPTLDPEPRATPSGARRRDRAEPFAPGERLLKYEVLRLCGQGGHACVYEAYDPFLDRRVAIKVIGGRPLSDDVDRRAQLEARVLCRLEHPNIVRVLDAGTTEDGVFIVMEWLEGLSLREVLGRVRYLTVSEALSIALRIAEGVHGAHELRVIHRDLKPENVMVLRGNQVKVLDFGVAKFLSGESPTTEKDIVVGTLRYMSPEHLLGQGVTARSDVYALGTVLYELLCGQVPCLVGIENTSIGLRELTAVQITRVPPRLDTVNPAVPRALALVVDCMLDKDPARRFASMAEVCSTLGALAERFAAGSEPSSVRELWRPTAEPSPPLPSPSSPLVAASTPAADGTPLLGSLDAAPASVPRARRRWNGRHWALLALMVGVAAVVLAARSLRRETPSAAPTTFPRAPEAPRLRAPERRVPATAAAPPPPSAAPSAVSSVPLRRPVRAPLRAKPRPAPWLPASGLD